MSTPSTGDLPNSVPSSHDARERLPLTKKPLILVDGMAYLYRAFHAMPELTNSSGQPTGAILGVLNMVFKLLDEYSPEKMAVIFDAPGKTFRDDMYADYKANRPAMPDPLRSQIEPLIDAIQISGIPMLRIAGVEADDVIGTLARIASDAGLATVISTSDKDMAQLVDDKVTLVNTMDNTALDVDGVQRKFGVLPTQIIDFLSLIGDSVDNVPGIKGVGAKTAAKWLGDYGSLDNLVQHAHDITGKAGERLRGALGDLDLYTRLVTIDCHVDLPLGLDDLQVRAPDADDLKRVFGQLELKSLLQRRLAKGASIESAAGTEAAAPVRVDPGEPNDYELVTTQVQLDTWIDKLKTTDLVAIGTETVSPGDFEAELAGICVAVGPGTAAYIPLVHRHPDAPALIDPAIVLGKLKPWLASDATKVGYRLKFDIHVLNAQGIELGGAHFDVLLESYLLNSTATRHELPALAAKYLGMAVPSHDDVCGKGAKRIGFDQIDIETASAYAGKVADVTLRLHQALWPLLCETPQLGPLYTDLEQPLIGVLQRMEQLGVMVDGNLLRQQSGELAEALARIESAAFEAAGGPFAIASPKQLQEVLFERLGLPVLGKTPTGQPSTAENFLQELAADYELPRLVLEYRALSKLKSTYTDKLPREINPRTGRIHTCYQQTVAATGRLSSTDPNLQNIPVRTQEGRRIRQAFVAPPGYTLLAADYSQIELRIMAHLSADTRLVAAFASGQDIHRATAAEVLGVPLDEVTTEQRRSAKAVNFGLIYGMSAFGLARQLGIERHDAQRYIDLYFERYPGVREYMDRTREQARKERFVSTVFGRRLYLPDITARNPQRRQYAERSAINAPMQGTAADIIKRAMLGIDEWIRVSGVDVNLIMQVHDELVFEVAADQVAAVSKEVISHMEGAADLTVSLKVDVGSGANWDEAH